MGKPTFISIDHWHHPNGRIIETKPAKPEPPTEPIHFDTANAAIDLWDSFLRGWSICPNLRGVLGPIDPHRGTVAVQPRLGTMYETYRYGPGGLLLR